MEFRTYIISNSYPHLYTTTYSYMNWTPLDYWYSGNSAKAESKHNNKMTMPNHDELMDFLADE